MGLVFQNPDEWLIETLLRYQVKLDQVSGSCVARTPQGVMTREQFLSAWNGSPPIRAEGDDAT